MEFVSFSTWRQVLIVLFLSHASTSERICLCVHNGFVLPVDQHPVVIELSGGTCAEIINENVHFRDAFWTLVMYKGHHAFVKDIKTEYDKVKCDANNIPYTTIPTTAETTATEVATTTTVTIPTTSSTTQLTVSSTSTPYCPPKIMTPQNNTFTCPDIIYVKRNEWGASSSYEQLNNLTQQYSCSKDFVVVHHTLGAKCSGPIDCVERLKSDIQNWKRRQFNFAVGGDGTFYELNGFTSIGKHADFFDRVSIGIAFIGDYSGISPTPAALKSLQDFLSCAVNHNYLDPSYILRTERDILGTGLGSALYTSISKLPHY